MHRINRTAMRALVTAAVAGVAAAALGGVSLAHAGGTDRTITVTEVQTGAAFVSVTHTQQGAPGDLGIFRSAVKNAAGRQIGSSSVACELVLGHLLQCNGIYRLPGGTLTGTALVPASQTSTAPVHIAITGGTGVYDNASGQATSTPQSDTVSRTVIDLD